MKHILVYFPYKLQENPKSGSGVRPKKMVAAFTSYAEKEGFELVVISGDSKERAKATEEYREKNRAKDASFCYMENATIPYWLTDSDHVPRAPKMDQRFWTYLKQQNVPIGLFYRDVYWKFDDMYVPPGGKKIFTPLMRAIYYRELAVFKKFVDIMYLPSLEMNDFVNWKGQYKELPPGMEFEPSGLTVKKEDEPMHAVFVGGITDQKGVMLMLEAFKKVNDGGRELRLSLVCREQEYKKYPAMHPFAEEGWCSILHVSGKELEAIYEKTDFAVIPREMNTYHHFSMPVKMFEYLANGQPILATNCKAQARVINEEEVGVTTDDDLDSFMVGLQQMLDRSVYEKLRLNIETYSFQNHSWEARARQVAEELMKGR
ncbi:glycosyltransferase [Alkalihalobacillus deserti]|uniref:glycosyltransferase n=1 Tax=Alkalihalobacillus deserti TaxID=2879466 RepID=UPI001D14F4D5|nr:glycosyltransferase [Alkalihalobacillus deserti]